MSTIQRGAVENLDEYQPMEEINRVILIGNGFDISHGLKTKYEHFMHFLLSDLISEARKVSPQNYSDQLLIDRLVLTEKNSKFRLNKGSVRDLFGQFQNKEIFTEFRPTQFIQALRADLSKNNWADFEVVYYRHLCDLLDLGGAESLMLQFNKSVEEVRKRLTEYFEKKVVNRITDELVIDEYNDIFHHDEREIAETFVVNFNYTSTFKLLYDPYESFEVVNIHGQCGDGNNVFLGYGDREDDNFDRLLDLNNPDIVKNLKSLHYKRSPESQEDEIDQFLDDVAFEVDVIGHSCGQSDRDVLRKVFDHQNCQAINIYHFNDFERIHLELERLLRDDPVRDRKIKRFDPKKQCPQFKKGS
ncbi:MAG: AbiH family protein [Cyclobacteriaceae bacterium]